MLVLHHAGIEIAVVEHSIFNSIFDVFIVVSVLCHRCFCLLFHLVMENNIQAEYCDANTSSCGNGSAQPKIKE